MTFDVYKEFIEENDTVILYISFNTMYPLKVTPKTTNRNGDVVDHVFQTVYGALRVEELIGKRFGTKVRMTRGYGYVLYPTPELWTKTLPHRTQILYATDISMILLQLELKPGSVVVESGTGSGSLSHSILRTIAPNGHLHTFDFHQKRVEAASKEFEDHGLRDLVTAKHGDACADGFGLENVADAVFLDLPHPWDAIPHAKKAMKRSTGGRICSFSPCIEQVQKAAQKMKELGFIEISTLECLIREFLVRRSSMPTYDHSKVSAVSNDEEGAKKRKLDEEDEANGESSDKTKPVPKPEDTNFVTGVPLTTMPGHTGYLTFATLPPDLTKTEYKA